jgi:hypothetical protein
MDLRQKPFLVFGLLKPLLMGQRLMLAMTAAVFKNIFTLYELLFEIEG